MTPTESMTLSLDALPDGAVTRSVIAEPGHAAGQTGLRVTLTDDAAHGEMGVDYGDQPTFLIIPADFTTGTIEVDILGRVRDDAPELSRAFAGIAYHLSDGGDHFESVYLRPTNGRRKVSPPSPRDQRAIQYFAYPEWPFDRLREVYPDGRYESGADIGPDEWIHLRLDIEDTRATAWVNGTTTLVVEETKAASVAGDLGLFVDIGTEAFFANLVVSPS